MKITRNATAPSRPGATPDNFTGTVRVDNVAMADAPSRVSTASVTFSPGARTVWHRHPAGQTILIVAGQGWVQRQGDAKETVNPGDTVFFSAGEKHWHGATGATGMTHVAVTESVDGTNVAWLEPVPDDGEQPRRAAEPLQHLLSPEAQGTERWTTPPCRAAHATAIPIVPTMSVPHHLD